MSIYLPANKMNYVKGGRPIIRANSRVISYLRCRSRFMGSLQRVLVKKNTKWIVMGIYIDGNSHSLYLNLLSDLSISIPES